MMSPLLDVCSTHYHQKTFPIVDAVPLICVEKGERTLTNQMSILRLADWYPHRNPIFFDRSRPDSTP
jgi:hypothetical protein